MRHPKIGLGVNLDGGEGGEGTVGGGREGVLWLGLNGGGKSLVGFKNIFGVPYNSVKS